MGTLIDISPTLDASIAVWPGDVPFGRTVSCDMKSGDNLTLSAITTTLHVGAHADAPNHYATAGEGISDRSLERYFGPCQVIRASAKPGQRLRREHFSDAIAAPRVLFHTNSFPDPQNFTRDFCSFSPDLIQFLHDTGVELIGIDTPSVDPFDDKVLLSHQMVARHDMAILEGLVLEHVEPGLYTLIALPLKIAGGDAAPVRAALLKA